ncbi:hypothetical protein CR513_47818, partial [Mucuna pruriens]
MAYVKPCSNGSISPLPSLYNKISRSVLQITLSLYIKDIVYVDDIILTLLQSILIKLECWSSQVLFWVWTLSPQPWTSACVNASILCSCLPTLTPIEPNSPAMDHNISLIDFDGDLLLESVIAFTVNWLINSSLILVCISNMYSLHHMLYLKSKLGHDLLFPSTLSLQVLTYLNAYWELLNHWKVHNRLPTKVELI